MRQQYRRAPKKTSLNYQALSIIAEPLKQHRWRVVIAVLTLVVTAFVVLAVGYAIQNFIDEGFVTGDRKSLNVTIFALTGTTLVIALCSYLRSYMVSWLGEAVIGHLRRHVFGHLLTLDVSFFEESRPGELVARLTTDTNLIQILVGANFALAMRNALLLVGGIVMMFTTSIKLTVYTLLLIPLLVIPIMIFGAKVKHFSKENQKRLADQSGFLEEIFTHIRTVKGYNQESREMEVFSSMGRQAFQMTVRRILARSTLVGLVMFLAFSGVGFVLWCGGQDVLAKEMTPGALSAFIFYAVLSASSAGSFSELYADIQRAVGAAERLVSILHLPSSKVGSRPLPQKSRGILGFHDVCFTYPSNPHHLVLDHTTFSISPGETVGLVGLSGSGKSTIFSLIQGFYKPNAGSIYMEGIDSRELNAQSMRDYAVLVSSDPGIFSGTMLSNIMYGSEHATKDQVMEAIYKAGLEDVIQQLPGGLMTHIGTKGTKLSTGQRQRIAIARAILKNPTILLLDEATSSLDAEHAHHVQQSLYTLMRDKTTLIIAHSLQTILKCDRILVLHEGKIQAFGTHAELMVSSPLYQKLVQLQFNVGGEPTRQKSQSI